VGREEQKDREATANHHRDGTALFLKRSYPSVSVCRGTSGVWQNLLVHASHLMRLYRMWFQPISDKIHFAI
jgi:hypothetical protein